MVPSLAWSRAEGSEPYSLSSSQDRSIVVRFHRIYAKVVVTGGGVRKTGSAIVSHYYSEQCFSNCEVRSEGLGSTVVTHPSGRRM